MNGWVIAGYVLAVWVLASIVAAPFIGACVAGRVMSRTERDALAWGGLAVVLALFFLATLVIGAHQ